MSAFHPINSVVSARLLQPSGRTALTGAPTICGCATVASRRASLLLVPAACALIFASGHLAVAAGAGKAKAEPCFACHGDNGISQMENTPSLAAQPDQFLQWQLVFFRSGARKSEVMAPVAEPLGNEDIRDLAAYFSSLKPLPSSETPDDRPELTEAGKKAVAQGKVHLLSRRQFCRQQGGGADRGATRGLSREGTA